MTTPLIHLYRKSVTTKAVAAAARVEERVVNHVLSGRIPAGYPQYEAVAKAAAFFCGISIDEMRNSIAEAAAMSALMAPRPARRASR